LDLAAIIIKVLPKNFPSYYQVKRKVMFILLFIFSFNFKLGERRDHAVDQNFNNVNFQKANFQHVCEYLIKKNFKSVTGLDNNFLISKSFPEITFEFFTATPHPDYKARE
jgi:hypothetical protein